MKKVTERNLLLSQHETEGVIITIFFLLGINISNIVN